MSRSFAYVSMIMLSLSLPINAWALAAPAASDERPQLFVDEAEQNSSEGPSCPNEKQADTESLAADGAIASTDQSAAEAQALNCCWVFFYGRWYCLPC